MTYKKLVDETKGDGYDQVTFNPKPSNKSFRIPILKIKGDQIIARYESISEAARENNLSKGNIQRVLGGSRKTTGGFKWKYE